MEFKMTAYRLWTPAEKLEFAKDVSATAKRRDAFIYIARSPGAGSSAHSCG
jgi:O-succinylbenzoate synthase